MQGKTELKDLEKYFQKAKSNKIEFKGLCHDCNREVSIKADVNKEGKITVSGGAIYFEDENDGENEDFFVKCEKCFGKDKVLRNYRECQVWSRTVGFYRPVSSYNPGKEAEFENRKVYNLPTKEELKSLNFE